MTAYVRLSVVLMASALLSGCAAIGLRSDLSPQDQQAIKSVGVVSTIGNRLTMNYRGTTIFQNKSLVLDVSEWNLNAFANAEAVAAIESLGDYDAHPIAMETEDIERAITAASEANYDAVVIISPAVYDNAPGIAPGVSFSRINAWGNRGNATCAVILARIYSVRTRKQIAWEWGFPTSGPTCYRDTSMGDVSWFDSMAWPAEAGDLSDESLVRLRVDTLKVVSRNVRYSVTNIGL